MKEVNAMAKKILFALVVGTFVVTLVGAASAEYLAMSTSNSGLVEPSADPERDFSQEGAWHPQEQVETGAIVDRMEGSSKGPQRGTVDSGLTFEPNGSSKLRPGIDDGH